MYDFCDTTETPTNYIGSEAVKINGTYIETQLSGYRTLYVSGREALSPELDTYETGVHDGSSLNSRKFPSRTITIGYQLLCSSAAAFRSAYNQLAEIINVQDAELIFADETDKFYTGTFSGISDVETGRNSVTGEFTFICLDPFKYSVEEYEVEPSADNGTTFVIDYNGTYKSYPTLIATFYEENEAGETGSTATTLTGNGDCGYVAFFNEDGAIIQLGNPDAEDTEDFEESQTLVYQNWKQVTAWTTTLNNLWAKNDGAVSSGVSAQTGTPGFKVAYTNGDEYYLTATDYGSSSSGYHGPSVTRTLPADSAGETGATDWEVSWAMKLNIGNSSSNVDNCGMFQLAVSNDDTSFIAGMSVMKSASGYSAVMKMYVNGKVMREEDINVDYNNKYFGTNSSTVTSVKKCSITKSGAHIIFYLGGWQTYFDVTAISDMVATKFTMFWGQYKSKPALPWNGVYNIKFVKNNCDWLDTPNVFTSGDEVEADCKNAEVTLNGGSAARLGALGNNWEDFYLSPGQNQIGTSYSDWVDDDYAPTFKIKYREVFL